MQREAASKTVAPERKAEKSASSRSPLAPSALHPILRMQRTIGNRAVGRMLQAKLRVGAPDDIHEREADRVADFVMRAPDHPPRASPSRFEADNGQVRRLCQNCDERRRKLSEKDELRRKELPAGGAPSTGALPDEHALLSGGEPLPQGVRSFYEERFGRDFGEVRVHTGPTAARNADDLLAHAFTYGNHIWMGRDQTIQPSFLLAHELAHVVQQSQPSASAQRKEKAGPVGLEDRLPVVRRYTPFWEPWDIRSGGDNHRLVLPVMGSENKIFTEAPVPNANLLSDGFNKRGNADLYRATTTVGLYFTGDTTPAELKSAQDLLKDGQKFPHKTSSAPRTDRGRFVIGSADAPKEVALGDLKPSHGTIEAVEGTGQLENYKRGFELAHKEATDPKTLGDGSLWNPFSVRILSAGDLTVPGRFTYPSFANQNAQKLVLKQGSSKRIVWDPPKRVEGHICVRPDPSNKGIWNYVWVPSVGPDTAQLPPSIKKLGPTVEQKIIDPLIQSPLKVAKRAKRGDPSRDAEAEPSNVSPSLAADSVGVVRRKDVAAAPQQDNFDYDAWKKNRKELGDEFKQEKKTPEFKEAEGKILANEAHIAIREKFGLTSLADVVGGKEPAKTVGKVEFWTGLTAAPFGFFRKIFGATFVRVAQFFIKMRDKVRGFLKKMKSAARIGSGFLGAALKAAFLGLKMIASFVVGRIVDRLMQSLIKGVTNKVKSLISGEFQDELEQKAAEVAKIREELEQKATETVDALLERIFGAHIKDLEKLKEIVDTFQELVQIIGLVRWGARVIACLSPPAFGCLWILAEGLLDYAAQKVAETCWFQEKIQPILAKVKYVTTDLPNKLGDGIIAKIRALLPTSLQDVFADLESGEVVPQKGDVECDEEDKTAYQEDPLHRQIDDLYLKLGPERAAALSLLASKMNVPKDRPLTGADLTRLGDELSKIDPAKLQQYAEHYPAVPEGVPTAVTKLVDQMEQQAASPSPQAPPPQSAAGQEVSKVDSGQPAKTETAGGKEGEAAGGTGGPGVIEARDRATDRKALGKDIPETKVQVVNVSWDHTLGTKTSINVIIWWKGDAKVLVRDIEVVVGRRYWFPRSAKTREEAVAIVIPYEVTTGVDISEVPDGLIPKGKILLGLIYTSTGEKALKALREAQANRAAAK